MSSLLTFVEKIKGKPEEIEFEDVMQIISDHYDYSPTRFTNGIGDEAVTNEAGTNEGSCKIFAFGKLHNLNTSEVLSCFGKFYRQDVLANPEGSDHANIRQFMRNGWDGITFFGEALQEK